MAGERPSTASTPAAISSSSPTCSPTACQSSPSNTPGEFPEVTTYDNVTQQRRLLNELFGVDRVKMVYGWSMGAQQAYHWAALFGDAVERIVVNCGSAKTAPHNFVFLEGVRTAVQAARTPEEGLRAMGRIYAGWALSQTFYRREMWRGLGFTSLEDFLVRSWEANFVRRNAARSDGPALDLAGRRHLRQRSLSRRSRRWRWPASRPRSC